MLCRISAPGFLLFVLTFLPTTATADKNARPKEADSPKTSQADVIFEKIKSLEGEWEHAKGEAKGKTALNVRVIAGGSAVVERQFPGTPMEMVTVYHRDGDSVMLNHYCMLGNQPRLKATMGNKKDTIIFSFVSATNLASENDAHMHEGRMTFTGKDSIRSTWTKFVDGKAAEDYSFDMVRKK